MSGTRIKFNEVLTPSNLGTPLNDKHLFNPTGAILRNKQASDKNLNSNAPS